MDLMKKFKKWILKFGLLVIIINILTYLVMIRPVNAVPHSAMNFPDGVDFRVIASEASDIRGFIRGELTNNTGELIRLAQLRIEFYNERGTLLGSEYQEIRLFNATQTINIDIGRNARNVDNIVIRWIYD